MRTRFFQKLRSSGARLLRDTRGATAVFMAVGLIPLIGSVGLAVDSSTGYLLKGRLSKSLDAAGLAAGRVALNEEAPDVARKYFDANFGTSQRVSVDNFHFELDSTRKFVTLTAEASTPTTFMQIFGQKKMTVAARTVIYRQSRGLELALVLDNTGSMNGPKGDNAPFNAMVKAANDLVDILYGDKDVIDNLWVSVVPFVTAVNIGNTRTGWLKSDDNAIVNKDAWGKTPPGKPIGWKGCVMARGDATTDTDDTSPLVAPFTSLLYTSGAKAEHVQSDKNYTCGAQLLSLTASRTTVKAALSNMKIEPSGTASNQGLVWGWRTISPKWRGLWGGATPAQLPLDYYTDNMDKVVVILTDGANNFIDSGAYTAYGTLEDLGFSDKSQGRDLLDTRTKMACESLKKGSGKSEEKVIVYSIIFGIEADTKAKDIFKKCATTQKYFYAPSNEELANVFRAIGGELSNLRIAE